MTTLNFNLDLESMVKRAVESEVQRIVSTTDWGYSTTSIKKQIEGLVSKAFELNRMSLTSAINASIANAAESTTLQSLLAKSSVEPIAKAVVGGMGNTFQELGRNLGRDEKFRKALLVHVRDAMSPTPKLPVSRTVEYALTQARFALRELLPDHPDAHFTIAFINDALAELQAAEKVQ